MSRHVGVGQLVDELRDRGDRLPFEIGAFVALETCEGLLRESVRVAADDVRVTAEGAVVVSEQAEPSDQVQAARSLVSLLSRLLVAAGPGVPPHLLQLVEEAALPNRPEDLQRLHDAIEASLVPINRGASRRVLARLVRESERPAMLEAPAPAVGELDAALDALLGESGPLGSETTESMEEALTSSGSLRAPTALQADMLGLGEDTSIYRMQKPRESFEAEPAPAQEPVTATITIAPASGAAEIQPAEPLWGAEAGSASGAVAEVEPVAASPSELVSEKLPVSELAAASVVETEPVAEPESASESKSEPELAPVSASETARVSGSKTASGSGVAAASVLSSASAPGSESEAKPESAALPAPVAVGGQPGSVSASATMSAPVSAIDSVGSAAQASQRELRLTEPPAQPSDALPSSPPRRATPWRALLFVVLIAGLVVSVQSGIFESITGSPGSSTVPTPAFEAGTIEVTVFPEGAQVFLFEGRGPVPVSKLSVTGPHEFLVFDKAVRASRAVVPAGATWESAPDGTPLYELAVQAPVRELGEDTPELVDLGEPLTTAVAAQGEPSGTVRVITNPPGAKVFRLLGSGPELQVQARSIHEGHELLVLHPGYEPQRALVGPSDWRTVPGRGAVASVELRLPQIPAPAQLQPQ